MDPNNAEVPQDDQLPAGVMFPIDPGLEGRWVTGPQGAQPQKNTREAVSADRPSADSARLYGRWHAADRKNPQHQSDFPYSKVQHGRYLMGWNEVAGMMHGLAGQGPISRSEYEKLTGRPDLHPHYLASYAEGRMLHSMPADHPDRPRWADGLAQTRGSLQVSADAWTQPHRTTDDATPPHNSPATTPPMTQDNGDYAAGKAAGAADKAAGQRPAFADNSSGVSQYVKGYAEAYGAASEPQGAQDVPYSIGGDSGQGANAQEAQRAFQVAQAFRTGDRSSGRSVIPAYSPASPQWSLPPANSRLSRISAAFAPASLFNDPEFHKGYQFGSKWKPGQRLVSQGSASFEAGVYCSITDRPDIQDSWLAAHTAQAGRHPVLARRIERHASFTAKMARRRKMRVHALYLTAGTSTDLITDGPGTSPDPMGSTPLNGPGTPPPMAGRDDASAPGGAPPYQAAPPLSGGPVVPDDVMGRPQQPPQPSGPFTNTFSGQHPENVTLAPVSPNSAAQPGYSNKDAYRGDPGDRADANPRLAAFRQTVQDNMARMGVRQ